jgi:hypothetical protein
MDVAAQLEAARLEVARLERLLESMGPAEARREGRPADDAHASGGMPQEGEASARRVASSGLGKENGLQREPGVIRGSATSYLGGPAQQDMNPGPKGKRSLQRGQGGVQIRKGQQKKGGLYAPDCYEESM